MTTTIGWLADYLRYSASPGAANALSQMNRAIDVRPALAGDPRPDAGPGPRRRPRLLHGGDPVAGRSDPRRAVRLVPGRDHFRDGPGQDDLLDEIERFVAEVGDEETDLDRVLATVMFTDIVGSTGEGRRARRPRLGRSRRASPRRRPRDSSAGSAGPRSTRLAMGSSPRSTAPRAASGAHSGDRSGSDFGIEVRAGVHTGEVETIGGKIGGIAVNVGARIASIAGPSEVLVSHTVRSWCPVPAWCSRTPASTC